MSSPRNRTPKDFVNTPLKSIAVPAVRRLGKSKAQHVASTAAAAASSPHYMPVTADARRGSMHAAIHPSHRFSVGDRLSMSNGGRVISRAASTCLVIACLPSERGPFRYRVRSESEGFERVVDEIDLSPLTDGLV
jgi:hypothetical protein